MTLERRIKEALSAMDEVQPSIDLWARVSVSIDEDRLRRRRVRFLLLSIATVVATLVAAGWWFRVETTIGRWGIDWRAMEVLESLVLVLLVVTLGPAIRRFGDGYAGAIFRSNPETGDRFIRLLDVAYYLVFCGFVLMTAEFERPVAAGWGVGEQLGEATSRIGGLLMAMGLLHAVTILVLPLVGLVFTAVWRQRRLPRWVNLLLLIVGVATAGWVLQTSLGIVSMGFGG